MDSSGPLASLNAHFDELVRKMRTPEAKRGVDALMRATPRELGEAAVKAARAKRQAHADQQED
ncbi:MAG: hypothetical protein ACREPQ_11665 [Rhodanobacter sp.]